MRGIASMIQPQRPAGKFSRLPNSRRVRIASSIREFLPYRRMCALLVLCCAIVVVSPAQTFTPLVSFNETNGADPAAPLVQGLDGNLYGTTSTGTTSGGIGFGGTIFRTTTSGTLTTLYSFCTQSTCTDGNGPTGLVQIADGTFYGTTVGGGLSASSGTVFKFAADGTLTTLYRFCVQAKCADGADPARTIHATDGSLYGTTNIGGAGDMGTFFSVTPSGTLTTLYSFCAKPQCSDGSEPLAGVVQARSGKFYGTTFAGGSTTKSDGTVFKFTAGGALTTLYRFCSQTNCADGAAPTAGLLQAADGNFHGTTLGGGAHFGGTVFRITPAGVLTTLYSFCSAAKCADGSGPRSELIQATDGNLYGTTGEGGITNSNCTHGCGTIFKITTSGVLTTLHSFCARAHCADGSHPNAALLQATDGNFYGSASEGGTFYNKCGHGCGMLFKLSTGLATY
jgi:uncharacterized repeat protein (TIGR03803 family)